MTVSDIIVRLTVLGRTAPFGVKAVGWSHGVADRHYAALHSGFYLIFQLIKFRRRDL